MNINTFTPPGAMLEAARGASAGHNGSYPQPKWADGSLKSWIVEVNGVKMDPFYNFEAAKAAFDKADGAVYLSRSYGITLDCKRT